MAIKKFDKIIFVAHDDLYYYQEKYFKYKEKFIWIPTFVDPFIFNNDIEKKDYKKEDTEIHYIYFGRFVKQKGMERLAEYLNYLRSKVILIMLSRWEGMPLTLIEALTTGTPAICSMVGEMKYIIKNGYNGYSFDLIDDSYNEIYKSSIKIWNNYYEFSLNSIDSTSDFLINTVVEKYNKLFLEL